MRTPDSLDYSARMTPPATLTQAERRVWRALVKSVSSDHFQDCDRPLLTEFCRSAVLADDAAEALRDGAVVGGKASPWIGVQEKAQRSLVALSARLRLCPQSRFDRLKAGRNARLGIDDDDDGDGLLATAPRPLTGLASFRR